MIISTSRQPWPQAWPGFICGGLDVGAVTVKLSQHLHAHKDRSLASQRNICYESHFILVINQACDSSQAWLLIICGWLSTVLTFSQRGRWDVWLLPKVSPRVHQVHRTMFPYWSKREMFAAVFCSIVRCIFDDESCRRSLNPIRSVVNMSSDQPNEVCSDGLLQHLRLQV